MAGPTIKAVITTLDNLPLLQEQAEILRGDELIDQIVVVSNGSEDGTVQWLAAQPDLTSVIRDNRGAGPGRNAGLDAAGAFDYALMLDGGIRPLRDGTARMLDYLERTPEADVIGLEIEDFETDYSKAWRRWPEPIERTYRNMRLSYTAYALTRARCWDGLRFCEEGPFGEPGWGVDDDEMACQWLEAGIVVHVVVGVHPYRRASGSFRRLYRETGIWPNQYGSVYEQRLVWMQQKWPQYPRGACWGEPKVSVVVPVGSIEQAVTTIKAAHDCLRKRRIEEPWQDFWEPYQVIAWGDCDGWREWAEPRRLRQHHGDAIIVDGQIVRRRPENETTWTGDFIVWDSDDYAAAVWPGAEVIIMESAEEAREAFNG